MGQVIEQRMAERGMRQKALEDASGINIRRVSDYIRGQRSPSLPNLRRLCRALDLSVDEFMDRTAKAEEELQQS